jgi:hypothetical protein
MKAYGGVDVKFHIFFTSTLVGGEWSASRSAIYPRYPLDRRLGGPQTRSGCRGEDKILDSTGIPTPSPQSSSP